MTTTVFVDGATLTSAAWFNDTNAVVYNILGNGTTAPSSAAIAYRGLGVNAAFAPIATAGTATAFTLTPTPASTANATGQRWRVQFNAASGATPTLAVSAQTAKSLKYYDGTGAKVAITSVQVPINWISDVEYDGTDWVVLQVSSVGYLTIPQVTKVADGAPTTGADLTYSGKHIYHTSTAGTFTIPANGSIAYPIGTALSFANGHGAGALTIAITTDTMYLAGAGTTGSRTLAADGVATALKVETAVWIISGVGLT